MKKVIVISMLSLSILSGCANVESLNPNTVTANKQLLTIDRGVVLMADNVNAKAAEMNRALQVGGAALVGSGIGTAAIGGYNRSNGLAAAGAAAAVVGLGALLAGQIIENQEFPAIRYTIQLQNGIMNEVIQIVPEGESKIAVNSPVFLKSYLDGTKYVFRDTTQGVAYDRTQNTLYKGDKEKQDKENAKKDILEKKNQERSEWFEQQERRRIEAETKRQEKISEKTDDIIRGEVEAAKRKSKVYILQN